MLSSQRPGSLALALGTPAHGRTQKHKWKERCLGKLCRVGSEPAAPSASSRVTPWDSPLLCKERSAGEDTPDSLPDLTTY